MTVDYTSEFIQGYVKKGELKGEARALLTILDARGFMIPDEMRACIESCRDEELLDAWLHRVATVESVEELFT
ncbi:hypothetical protein [Allonocardiopsis opalescens]|uniref:DUF4351 domain-containing protein n=1 Tax=Allonocardiopsis opalescens TaxID=1144618 RepID=A0A2T0PXP3_9ACTN|nr:hypothetical protein [Allonocardiopsis opalescens]PRX96208.1 hypothetical protein CLV72_108214 [Allonocardiopsis opalescens]